MLVDSDCLFTAAFDPRSLLKNGRVPLFREEKDWYCTDRNTQTWHRDGGRILGLARPVVPNPTGYVGPHVFWRRDVLVVLDQHLGAKGPREMARRVAFCMNFSEYVLYGMFVEHVLGLERAGHYAFNHELVHNYWPEIPVNDAELLAFKEAMPTDKVMVHINGKSRTPESAIAKLFLPELEVP